jgi:hypothetical protein
MSIREALIVNGINAAPVFCRLHSHRKPLEEVAKKLQVKMEGVSDETLKVQVACQIKSISSQTPTPINWGRVVCLATNLLVRSQLILVTKLKVKKWRWLKNT